MSWPLTIDDVSAARERIAGYLAPTPLRHYPLLDEAVGHDVRVLVKHENHQPTCSFKVRNALSAMTLLDDTARARGVIAATRGNHGQGVAFAGRELGVDVTICVPHGNNPDKNAAMRALGATLIEDGHDYDAALVTTMRLVEERGLEMIHSTNDRRILAGAATISAEIFEQAAAMSMDLDAMVVTVGGGSQCVGAMTVARATARRVDVYAVQASEASAIHDGWHAGSPVTKDTANTFADGIATRACYSMTFDALREGLSDFITCSEEELAAAVRMMLDHTHNLAEGAGAAGLAGLCKLAPRLAGKTVAIILSGGNIDRATLKRVLT